MTIRDDERFTEEQLVSLQIQTHSNWRLLVSADCSDDGTLDVIERLTAIDSRILVASEGNRFSSTKANIMHLLSLSEAPYVMFCDQDGVWLPDKMSHMLDAMRALEGERGMGAPLLVFSDMAAVDESLNLIDEPFGRWGGFDPSHVSFAHLLASSMTADCTIMLNRPLVNLCVDVADVDSMVSHGWWAMLVASALGHTEYVTAPLTLRRLNGSAVTNRVTHSLTGKPESLADMRARFENSLRQARAFEETYADMLDVHCANKLARYVEAGACSWSRARSEGARIAVGHDDGKSDDLGMRCVWGGVVTHNPDIDLLQECLKSVIDQVSMTVVFDNASDDIDAVRSLMCGMRTAGSNVRLLESPVNVGMAVALNRIAEFASGAGAEAVLYLDQDSIASPSLVTELSLRLRESVALACPIVLDRNIASEPYDPRDCFEVKRAITSGSLVDLNAWEHVGGYDERLFVDWVDMEFCDNLRTHGYRMLKTHSASISHEMGHAEYAWSGPGRDFTGRRRQDKGYYRSNYPAWRWEDRARAELLTIRKYCDTRICFEEVGLLFRSVVGRIIFIENEKSACLEAVLRGLISGLSEEGRKSVPECFR